MNPSVPPKFKDYTQFLGFTGRDAFLLAAMLFLLLAIFVLPIEFTYRVLLAVVCVLIALFVIFFRLPSGYTIEEWAWFWIMFISRAHYHQRGANAAPGNEYNATAPAMDVVVVPYRPGWREYVWMVWRRWVESRKVQNLLDRVATFYALSSGEPMPSYYRSVWMRELSGFVYLAGKNKIQNFYDLKPLYPSVNFWAIVQVLQENDLLEWQDDKTLICRDVRRMRALIRHGLVRIPDTDVTLVDTTTQI